MGSSVPLCMFRCKSNNIQFCLTLISLLHSLHSEPFGSKTSSFSIGPSMVTIPPVHRGTCVCMCFCVCMRVRMCVCVCVCVLVVLMFVCV